MTPIERTVRRAWRRLASASDGVVVGASGGPDSTALLAALVALRDAGACGPVVAAHLDHGLRGADAARDRDAAAALAARLGVPFVAGAADARAEAARRGTGSLEAAARAVRYRFLLEAARAHGATRVAVGHTADDQAETVLLRAARGTGLTGLGGIPRRRTLAAAEGERPAVTLVRPLLGATRAEVREHLAARGLPAVEDASNADPRFRRNRIRREVLPLLRDVTGPGVDAALRRLAAQARRAARALDAQAEALLAEARRAAGGEGLDAGTLRGAARAVRDRALALVATREGAPDRAAARHVRLLARALRAGGAVTLPGGATLAVVDGRLVRRAAAGPDDAAADADLARAVPLPVPGAATFAAGGVVVEATLRPAGPGDVGPHDDAAVAVLDAAAVTAVTAVTGGAGAAPALAVRGRRAGDRYRPLGAPGGRSLKQLLIDRKVPRAARATVPVVTLADRPAWVVGHPIDERLKVTPTTTTVLELRARASVGVQKGP